MGKAQRLKQRRMAEAPVVLDLADYQALKIAALQEENLRTRCEGLLRDAERTRVEVMKILAQKYPIALDTAYGFDDAAHALVRKG